MFYYYTKFHANPLDDYGEIESNVFTHSSTCSGGDLYPLRSFRTHNSSLEGAMELKFLPILLLSRCSFHWYHFLANSKFSDFGQKPWSEKSLRKVCQSKGNEKRATEPEICTILLCLRCSFAFFVKVYFFSFLPKTMDYLYSQGL